MNKKIQANVRGQIIELKQSRNLMVRVAVICQSNRSFDFQDDVSNYELQVVPQSFTRPFWEITASPRVGKARLESNTCTRRTSSTRPSKSHSD